MLDFFIILVAAWAILTGWFHGFLKEIASSLGFFLGLYIAARCYVNFESVLVPRGSDANFFTALLAFLIIWIVVPMLLGMLAVALTQFVERIHLGFLNQLGGIIVSLLKYGILLSCIFNAMSYLHIIDDTNTAESHFYQPVKGLASKAIHFVMGEGTHVNWGTETVVEDSLANDTVWIERTPVDSENSEYRQNIKAGKPATSK